MASSHSVLFLVQVCKNTLKKRLKFFSFEKIICCLSLAFVCIGDEWERQNSGAEPSKHLLYANEIRVNTLHFYFDLLNCRTRSVCVCMLCAN